ncbi:MAG: rhodanese-like domain-containing protein [Acidimicrobiia bacterium]
MGELTASAMVDEAKSRIENLTPEEVAKEIEGGALMVDIREEEELRSEGRIPDAVSAPRGMLEFLVDPTSAYHREEFQPDRRIVLYCSAGGRSALGADTMQRMGYSQVAHLDGGFTAWKEQGRPVEHDA